MSTKDRKAEHQ